MAFLETVAPDGVAELRTLLGKITKIIDGAYDESLTPQQMQKLISAAGQRIVADIGPRIKADVASWSRKQGPESPLSSFLRDDTVNISGLTEEIL